MDLKYYLNEAMKTHTAISAHTVNNLETMKTLIETSIETNEPIIAMVSPSGIKYFGGVNVVQSMFDNLKNNLKAKKVFLHLDHSLDVKTCRDAMNAGFDSVMFDGSMKSFKENVKLTKQVVAYKKGRNILVEGEIGQVGGKEDDVATKIALEDYDVIVNFYKETKVDMLAASVGTVHGVYKTEPKIKFDVVKELVKLNVPLVLHGSSGLDDATLLKLISSNEAKINVNTKNQQALIAGLKSNIDSKFGDIRDLNKTMMKYYKQSLIESVNLFKNVK